MKSAVRNVLVWGMLFVGLSVYAIDDTPLQTARIESAGVNSFTFYVKTYTSKVQLKIRDIYGNEVYSERLEKGNYYKKKYDMSALPEGPYYINVSDKNTVKLYLVEGNKISLLEEVGKIALEKKMTLLKALRI